MRWLKICASESDAEMANRQDNVSSSDCSRGGHRRSRPSCRVPTVAAAEIEEGVTTIGVAALINVASPGGPRYDASLTSAALRALAAIVAEHDVAPRIAAANETGRLRQVVATDALFCITVPLSMRVSTMHSQASAKHTQ